jgi:hypothetical protein
MITAKYRFYEPRGHSGYVHAACWHAFEKANTVVDSAGRVVHAPVPSSANWTIGLRAGNRPCLHCHEPLIEN